MMLPNGVFTVRRSICLRCVTPCDQQHNADFYGAACSACPLPKRGWGPYGKCATGLGTRLQLGIHAVLDVLPMPDATRNAIKSCGGCAQRRDALDRAFPGEPDVPAP